MMEITDVNGVELKEGDLITWKVFDSDDFVTWQMFGIYRKSKCLVTYLGGGVDFGAGIGDSIPVDDVVSDSEANDDHDVGITVIGEQSDVPRLLSTTSD